MKKKLFLLILLISNRKGRKGNPESQWHYLAVKKISTLLRRIKSKHHGDFFVSTAFILSQQKTKLNHLKRLAKIKIFVIF